MNNKCKVSLWESVEKTRLLCGNNLDSKQTQCLSPLKQHRWLFGEVHKQHKSKLEQRLPPLHSPQATLWLQYLIEAGTSTPLPVLKPEIPAAQEAREKSRIASSYSKNGRFYFINSCRYVRIISMCHIYLTET